jgi:hypothetical protein
VGASLLGVIPGDTVNLNTSAASGLFSDSGLGNNKAVFITGNTISGASAGNYSLQPLLVTASILPTQQTVQSINAVSNAVVLTSPSTPSSSIVPAAVQSTTTISSNVSNSGTLSNDNSNSNNNNNTPANSASALQNPNNPANRGATITQVVVGSQVQAISIGVAPSITSNLIGAPTLAPIKTPTSAQDAADPVLNALPSFVPNTSSFRAKTASTSAKTPVIPSLLTLENTLPKAATQSTDDGNLSASGNRSRW